jgi:hypothetical protein
MLFKRMRQLVRLPWAADSCPWVGKLRTVLPLKNRVIRDSAVQLGLTHQRGASGVDSPGRIGVQGCGDAAGSVAAGAGAAVDPTVELARLLSHNDYTAAFNNALTLSDVSVVNWLIRQARGVRRRRERGCFGLIRAETPQGWLWCEKG